MCTDIEAQVTLPGGGTARRSDSVRGLGDIEFWPLALSWSALSSNLHVGGIYAPSGEFQKKPARQPGARLT